jgi:hypothetical protein
MSNATSYAISIFPEPNSLSIEDIRLKKTLTDKLQASQDRMNGLVEYEYYNYKTLTRLTDNADISIEVAFGKFEILNKKLRVYKIPCTMMGQDPTLKNIKECPAYYYTVTYSLPFILKITDKSGKIINIESTNENDTIMYGYSQLSGHLQVAKLDEAYNQPGTVSYLAKEAMKSKIEKLVDPVQQIISFYKEDEKLDIAAGSGKAFDYTELTTTQSAVVDALSKYKTSGADPSAVLTSALTVWNKELSSSDLNNKQARINLKVTVGLLRNKVIAYLYLYDLPNAEKTMAELSRTFAALFNQTDKADLKKLEEKISRMKKMGINLNANKFLLKEAPVKADKVFEKMTTDLSNTSLDPIKGGPKYTEFKADYENYIGSAVAETGKTVTSKKEDLTKSMINMAVSGSASENKDYKTRIVNDPGKEEVSLKLFPFAGDSFKTLPVEVCNLTDLTLLNATGIDDFNTIPPEIGNLVNLKKLNLYSNSNLKSIPSTIGKLTKLELLDVSNCTSLTDLPDEITSLKNLKSLFVKGSGIPASRITALKAAMSGCKIK